MTTTTAMIALVLSPVVLAQPADDTGKADAPEKDGMASLTELAPEMLFQEMRYYKFYGGPNFDAATINGSLAERQYLLGSLGGARDTLSDNGLLLDFGVTQVLQGVAAGDSLHPLSYVGSADLWVSLDTGKAGLWPGGLIYTHTEGNWGDPLKQTGALLPTNFDATMPGPPASLALSEFYITQALSEQVIVVGGKADWAAFVDTTFFANNGRTQFLNTGLVNNALLGVFVPYTAWGAFLMYEANEELAFGGAVIQNAGRATATGFDDFDINKLTFGAAAIYNPTIGDLPGSYQFIGLYSNKDDQSFAIDRRYLLAQIIGLVPPVTEDGNYAFAFTASQYVWVDQAASGAYKHLPPVGWGPFFRFGIAPGDRNVIDQFYSVGVGGTGAFGRPADRWGVGWAGSHISGDLRRLVPAAIADVSEFEHVIEGFYNIALTPAVALSFDIQYVHPFDGSKQDLLILGTRLQLDF